MKTVIMKNRMLIGAVIVCSVLIASCDKSNPLNPEGACFGGNWYAQYADELEAWTGAAQEYSNNPTTSNCSKYKAAAKDYLDAIDDVYDCVPTANRKELDEAIKEAKADVDAEECNTQ